MRNCTSCIHIHSCPKVDTDEPDYSPEVNPDWAKTCEHYADYVPEHERCDKLLKALLKEADEYEQHEIDSDLIITVKDTTVKFPLGGPQIDAMIAFINHLAAENWHEVDLEKRTVTGVL